ncbi:hypothetical protein KP77_04730 [Jeotgalibacillus alimentarius]|uniref:Uncharacterized protein n=1 Tax=Jeotgalibacillus alimentarius TaxID=135826 RepID=A0A0C2VXF2_9BACL|nr:hypothetical protein KP77_04730 [Jeotgalibacillus alimentarius]
MQASDYIDWAQHHLYLDDSEIKKLAGMSLKELVNLFEIEKMFDDAMKSLQLKAPSEEECANAYIKGLHSKLLMPVLHADQIAKEIYRCTIAHEFFEEQVRWQDVSDMIDDFQYGDNVNGYTTDQINRIITTHARKLWHMKPEEVDFTSLLGQKITDVDSDIHFIIQLEKGAVIIECPWRIRHAGGILLGETDLQSNQRGWKEVKELLVGKTIEDVQLFEQCPLLIVQFDHLFLDVFHASAYFDGWTLTDEDDFYLFSMHGGVIA